MKILFNIISKLYLQINCYINHLIKYEGNTHQECSALKPIWKSKRHDLYNTTANQRVLKSNVKDHVIVKRQTIILSTQVYVSVISKVKIFYNRWVYITQNLEQNFLNGWRTLPLGQKTSVNDLSNQRFLQLPCSMDRPKLSSWFGSFWNK